MRAVPFLTFTALVLVSLIAGAFFAFSAFVMRGLARLSAAQGAEAMRAINMAAVGPGFMLVFMGGTALAAVLAVVALARRGEDGMGLLLAATLVYLVGSFGVTVAFNVPLNDRLAGDAGIWPHYLTSWTSWNHVRTLASIIAFVLLTLSFAQQTMKSS